MCWKPCIEFQIKHPLFFKFCCLMHVKDAIIADVRERRSWAKKGEFAKFQTIQRVKIFGLRTCPQNMTRTPHGLMKTQPRASLLPGSCGHFLDWSFFYELSGFLQRGNATQLSRWSAEVPFQRMTEALFPSNHVCHTIRRFDTLHQFHTLREFLDWMKMWLS